jgi:hypothetical protein
MLFLFCASGKGVRLPFFFLLSASGDLRFLRRSKSYFYNRRKQSGIATTLYGDVTTLYGDATLFGYNQRLKKGI